MKLAWLGLIISAMSDGFIASMGIILGATQILKGTESIPRSVITVAVCTGLMAFWRTVGQHIKITPETLATLKGDDVVSATATQTDAVTPSKVDSPVVAPVVNLKAADVLADVKATRDSTIAKPLGLIPRPVLTKVQIDELIAQAAKAPAVVKVEAKNAS